MWLRKQNNLKEAKLELSLVKNHIISKILTPFNMKISFSLNPYT